MSRFQYQKTKSGKSKVVISICVFVVVIIVFFYGISSFSTGSEKNQKQNLENALNRAIVYCYTTEGSYPESLDYIKNNYGLVYNEDLFYVDYRPIAENIYPEVTIIEKGESK